MQFLAIGGLGAMLSPSAEHLQKAGYPARCTAVFDRGNPEREPERKAWLKHGSKLISSYADVPPVDAVVVCAGKDGDDSKIFEEIKDLEFKTLIHLSTVSTSFVNSAYKFWSKRAVNYLNCPLTGGPKGAKEGTMLILASGQEAVYAELLPFFEAIGTPRYFGESSAAGAEVKLIGQVMVFTSLLGMATAIRLQEKCLPGEDSAEFFDFLNKGAGGCRQWDVALRNGVANDNWKQGFDIRHAVVDAIYALRLIEQKGLPQYLTKSLLTVIELFAEQLKEGPLATHAILKHLDKPGFGDKSLDELILLLPQDVADSIDSC